MADQPPPANRFKPVMPNVPGVPSARPPAPQGSAETLSKQDKDLRLVVLLAVGVVVAGIVGWFAMRPARQPPKEDTSLAAASDSQTASAVAASDQPGEPPRTATGPGTVRDLATPWSSRTFKFRRGVTGEMVDAMIIRLPQGGGNGALSYWAFSLKDPFGSCAFEFVTDLKKLSAEYGFRARHPMVGNPCSRALFDPLQLAVLPSGAWGRGAIVYGTAVRPPLSIEIRIEGNQIIAVQME